MCHIIKLICEVVQRQELASRNEREENFINIWGFETLLAQKGLHNLLNCARK
jgi:hypothetical protein